MILYPYLRGLVSELGFDVDIVEFYQPLRKYGSTKNNLFTLYDLALLGIVKHSRTPLRFMTLLGFVSSLICLVIATIYFVLKLMFWDSLIFGSAPMILGLFTISSIQIILLGF